MVRYSFVVPIYRDSDQANDFCDEFERVFRGYLGTEDIAPDVELIFVNDDGSASTSATLRAVCDQYPFAKLIALSRNFGQHIALSCGYAHARGQYVGMLNVDMEDPPNQIPTLLTQLENGSVDVMFGLRPIRRGPRFVRATSYLFHWFLNKATGFDVPLNTATLRIMNRKFVDAYNSLNERTRYIPGLEMWLGFRRGYCNIEHVARKRGRSSYNFRNRLSLAFEAIISFSDLPLRFLVVLGMVIALIGFLATFALVIGKIAFVAFRPGYTSTISIIVFLGGVQTLVIGVASLYIGRILKEVQKRPLYVVSDRYGIEAVNHV